MFYVTALAAAPGLGRAGARAACVTLQGEDIASRADKFANLFGRLVSPPSNSNVDVRAGLVEGDDGDAARAVRLGELAGDSEIETLARRYEHHRLLCEGHWLSPGDKGLDTRGIAQRENLVVDARPEAAVEE